jgi:hypothetical protein
LKDPAQRAAIGQVAGQLMGAVTSTIPGTLMFLQPNPVLEISTGATASQQGQYAYAISGIDPKQVYDSSDKLIAKMRQYPGFLFVNSDLYSHTPNLQVDVLRDPSQTLWHIRNANPHDVARRLFAKLQLPHQAVDGPIPGHCGSCGREAFRSRGPEQALHPERVSGLSQ